LKSQDPGNNLPEYTDGPDPNDGGDDDEDECETATSSVCGFTVSYETNGAGSTTSTVTASICETATGCPVTGSATTATVTPTPTVKPYVVYPQSPTNAGQISSILAAINALNPAPNYVYQSTSSRGLGTLFFFANGITDAQAQSLLQVQGVIKYRLHAFCNNS